ncbi:MAG: iron-containing alcohol dehydrogenase, partial [Candidatus Cloacimonas sp.]|nr:iron-containing alcohol dehydrogenase [Candidatus Cloacimonas sp.]
MFYCPVRIIFAEYALKVAKDHFAALGKKALIVSGKHSARLSGALAETLAVLSEVGQTYYLYDEISENPDLGSIMKGDRKS